jgi:hypothetical protein
MSFVAAQTTRPVTDRQSSSEAISWVTTSRCSEPGESSRALASESTSSRKRRHGTDAAARSNRRWRFPAVWCARELPIVAGETRMYLSPYSPASARPRSVFPVPGGP